MRYGQSHHQFQKALSNKVKRRANLLSRVVPFFSIITVLCFSLLSAPAVQADNTTRVYLQNVPVQDEKLLVGLRAVRSRSVDRLGSR